MSPDASHLRQRIVRLRAERNDLEDQALRSRDMVRGSLIELMRRCGKSGCKCQRGELHGPNVYLSLPKPGKRSQLLPIPTDKVKILKDINNRYHDYQQYLTRIRHINKEIESYLISLREEQLRIGEERIGISGLPPT